MNGTELTIVETKEPEACSCDSCKRACKRPGWPTPAEANRMMDLGLAGKMMCDFWAEDAGETWVDVLCPANPRFAGYQAWGHRERPAAFMELHVDCVSHMLFGTMNCESGCVFQGEDGLCEVHNIAKPYECRMLSHGDSRLASHERHVAVRNAWDTDDGRAAVARWKILVGIESSANGQQP